MRESPDTTDQADEITPFLGKAKELPERTQKIVRNALSSAKAVEGAGSGKVEPCPVCGTKIDGLFVAVEIPGRRSELLPKKLVHMVLAHDFWHPSMQILTNRPAVDDQQSEESGDDSDQEVIEHADPDTLPFSELSDKDVEQVQIDVSQILLARDLRRGPPSPAPAPKPRPDDGAVERRVPNRRRSRREAAAPKETAITVYRGSDEEADQIQKAYGIDQALARGLSQVARSVGAHPFDLANLVNFESRFDPSARGPSDVGATGLIQFTPRTARDLGTTTDVLRRMTAEAQLPYVRKYLDRVRNGAPLDTPHKLCMAVFYPVAMAWTSDQEFPEDVVRKNTYEVGDGTVVSIRTPADYVRRVELRSALPPSVRSEPSATQGPLDGIFSWFSNLFSSLTGAVQNGSSPPAEEALSNGAPATGIWNVGPGVTAVLVDEAGREWPSGRVPVGKYKLMVPGRPPSEVQISANRSYRASSIGRMFDDVVDGG